ncbi:MAG: DedA family protein [bacterium]
MDLLRQLVDIFLHLDQHLRDLVQTLGPWTYALLFLVIFAETGLVFIPFLPGDSLLFATGAVLAIEGTGLNIWLMMVLLFIAAVIGDAVNYAVGRYVGPKVFKENSGILFNKEHLLRTKKFYDRHGGKTIIIARFIPIVRTFAPFVAGIGHMNYLRFASYNIVGAFFWVFPFVMLGYFFGNLPAVQKNFHYVIVGIIALSVMPIVIEFWKARVEARKACKA